MRRVLTVLAAASALVVTACGGSSTSSGADARAATIAAFQKAQSQSLRFDLDGRINADASHLQNVPPDILRQVTNALGGGGTLTITAQGDQESPQRARLTLTLAPLVPQQVTAVLYDGTFYYSLDGGKTFGTGGSLGSLTGGAGLTPDQSARLFQNLPDSAYSDRGRETLDGVAVEHYQAQITKDSLTQVLGGGTSTGSRTEQNLQLLEQFVTMGPSSADAWVRADDGRLDRYAVNVSITFDIGKLAQAFSGQGTGSATSAGTGPSGGVDIGIAMTYRFHDYGASITVQKPTVDPNAPRLPGGLGGLFGG